METKDYSVSQPLKSSSVLFHGNEVFINKLLSRSSLSSDEQYSHPRKSEAYNCKLPGTVPFQWELKPGIPKDPPINEEEDEDSSPIILEPSLRLKKVSSWKFNNNHQNQIIIKKRTSLTGPNKTSWFFKRSKKTLKKSATFLHSESSNSDDRGFFSSSSLSSPSASKSSSSSTTAATESRSHKALATSSSPMSSRFRSLAKRFLRRLF